MTARSQHGLLADPRTVIVVLAGLSGGFVLPVIGQLYGTEIMLAPAALALASSTAFSRVSRNRLVVWLLTALLMWLIAQVVTDLWRGTESDDYLRGWFKIVMTAINLFALHQLLATKTHIMLFGSSFALGLVLGTAIDPSHAEIVDPWKFGYGLPLTLLAVVLLERQWRQGGFWAIVGIAVLAGLNFSFGFRSLAGVCFVAAGYLLVGPRMRTKRRSGAYLISMVALMVLSWLAVQSYAIMAERGLLGATEQARFERQNQGAYGFLVSGRGELFASSRAIVDSPVIGHGSWARDPEYANLLLHLRDRGYVIDDRYVESGAIPTHSFLAGAWVEAGAGSVPFWLLSIALSAVALRTAAVGSPLVAFLAIHLLWGVAFSPYAGHQRVLVPFALVVLLRALHDRRTRASLEGRSCERLL